MTTVTLKVEGMSCGGCVASVTRVLSALPGVSDAAVSLQAGTAQVTLRRGAHQSGGAPRRDRGRGL